jgi:hypothetical protein
MTISFWKGWEQGCIKVQVNKAFKLLKKMGQAFKKVRANFYIKKKTKLFQKNNDSNYKSESRE